MAYRKSGKTTRRSTSRRSAARATKRPTRRASSAKRATPQTLRIVIEQGSNQPDPVAAMLTPTNPKRARF